MLRAPLPVNNSRKFVKEILNEGFRIDSRSLTEFRPVQIEFPGDYGVVRYTQGNTKVLVSVSAELTQPFEDRASEGMFMVTTELNPMAAPWFNQNDSFLDRIIEKAIRRSAALDLESLCVIAGKVCWRVRADVHVLEFDGNLIDAICAAVITALRHYRHPDTAIDHTTNDVRLIPTKERNPIPLNILHTPISVTFSFYHDNDELLDEDESDTTPSHICLCDATREEESFRSFFLIVTINKSKEICQMYKSGGFQLSTDAIIDCVEQSYKRAVDLTDFIETKLTEDSNLRDPEWKIKLARADNTRIAS
ncbi:hypothetical protein CANCADRAFT_22388 [Tortispora caseinolytica NRRL Y-17796]|uniref:Uncharacterized protein n=1 Tax=Tortispora caseinolytica NRRL Y-17796 TaxID=767744 RepID=A0A1E4TKS2_9ASCO|nr:hypothetical protein CANCADRAFT_22388 [Tortispora caseinolytica NRRL Y-17796]